METFKEFFGLVPKKKRAASSSVGRQESKRDQKQVTHRPTQLHSKAPGARQRILKRTATQRVTVLKYQSKTRETLSESEDRSGFEPERGGSKQRPRGLRLQSSVLLEGVRTRHKLKIYRLLTDHQSLPHKSLRWFEAYKRREEDEQVRRLMDSRILRNKRLKQRRKRVPYVPGNPEPHRDVRSSECSKRPKWSRTPAINLRVLRFTPNPPLIKANKHLILSSDWETVTRNVDGVKNRIVSLFWTHLEQKLFPPPKHSQNKASVNDPPDLLESKLNYPSDAKLNKGDVLLNRFDSMRMNPTCSQDPESKTVPNKTTRGSCGLLKMTTLSKAVSETVDLIRSCKINLKKL